MTPEDDLFEVCIVGAGIAGMNALVVASGYLPKTARVLVADTRPRVGGMWVDTYDHVRLHQPHGIFTAGNIRWALDVAPSHLATKPEVLEHFQRCFGIAAERVDLESAFGWTYESHREHDGLVEVTFTGHGGDRKVVSTKRLIKAFGHHVTPNAPLALSSTAVRSITPELIGQHGAELAADDAPVWIIGGGKTALDAAHMLISSFPDREINMLAGPGTIFTRRETFFPVGARRWWTGTPINAMARQTARRFDGTNEDDVRDWFRATYGNGLTNDARDYFGAYLSDVECNFIKAGLSSVENEYLADAVDHDGKVELRLRTGEIRIVPAGTWVVNCTGSLLRELSLRAVRLAFWPNAVDPDAIEHDRRVLILRRVFPDASDVHRPTS